jgi:mono/diheme cytochrome c family protein/DNA-binding beta-propeller fold protein YncE
MRTVAARRLLLLTLLGLASAAFADEPATTSTAQSYSTRCAACHGAERLGGSGPALLPGNLERLRRDAAKDVIANGRIATQMPGFGSDLSSAEIQALVDFIYTQPSVAPVWGTQEIRASRIAHPQGGATSDKPVFTADPLNLFVVVEAGDHHATILDGDKFEPIARFPTRYALHGGPKFSSDGRYVYFASRDGWISKYDIYNLRMRAEVRAGINTRNLAVSSDGRFVAVGNYLPHSIVILNAEDLTPIKVIAASEKHGKSSRVSAIYDAAPRKSFVAALKDIPEVWEIPYGDDAEPVYEGMVHDYQLGEGIAAQGPFPVRRIQVEDYLDDFFFDQGYDNIIGAARDGAKAQVVNLNVRRKITALALPGLPHLGSGITWERDGHTVMGTPNLKQGLVSVIEMKTWKKIGDIETLGPGFFLRSHEHSRYAWVDNFNSKANDALQVIDKQSLEIVRTLRPAPGKTAAHVEFTRDGKYALASIWDMDGAIVVYDAATLEEVKRIPMKKPSGKYNVYNKTTRSSGTSH